MARRLTWRLRVSVIPLLIGALSLTTSLAQWRTIATSKKPAEVTRTRTTFRYRESSSQAKKHASLQALYKKACPSVVKIITNTDQKGESKTGSGFFVSKSGLVVTNWHVISSKNFSSVVIETSGQVQLKAKVLAIDTKSDLAILRPTTPTLTSTTLTGRPFNEVKVGDAVVIVGHPSDRRVLFYTGAVTAKRTAEELQGIIESKLPLKHGYKYLQIDVPIYRNLNGAPVLDEKGQVIGVISLGVPAHNVSFAIEWQAVADLMKKAKEAVPIGPSTIAQISGDEQFETTCFGSVKDLSRIGTAAELAIRSLYCGKCHGTGIILEKKQVRKKELRKVLITGPGITPHYRYKWVTVTETQEVPRHCPLCAGHGISPKADLLYKRICNLVWTMSVVSEMDEQVSTAWQKGVDALSKAAFDNIWYANDLTRYARGTLSTPQKHVGEPVVFIGRISTFKPTVNANYLLVVVYGTNQPVYVWAPGNVTALEGQWCQVSGVIGGLVGNTPLVLAVDVSGLHVNPKLKPLEIPKAPKRRRR